MVGYEFLRSSPNPSSLPLLRVRWQCRKNDKPVNGPD